MRGGGHKPPLECFFGLFSTSFSVFFTFISDSIYCIYLHFKEILYLCGRDDNNDDGSR